MMDKFDEAPKNGSTTRGLGTVDTLRLLLVGLWLGAAVFFSFVLAPSVFAVLPSRELAGLVVQRTLAVINISGFVIGLTALITLFPVRRRIAALWFWAETVLLALMTAAVAIGHWVITRRLHGLRAQLGLPIDLVPPDDPIRLAFNQLHGYSVILLTVGMVSALAAWLLIARHTKISGSRK